MAILLVFIILSLGICAGYLFYNKAMSHKELMAKSQLRIEEEKTKQYKLAAGIVDEFDAQPILDRLEERLRGMQNSVESQERRAILSKESHQKEMDELHKHYSKVIREVQLAKDFRVYPVDDYPIVQEPLTQEELDFHLRDD